MYLLHLRLLGLETMLQVGNTSHGPQNLHDSVEGSTFLSYANKKNVNHSNEALHGVLGDREIAIFVFRERGDFPFTFREKGDWANFREILPSKRREIRIFNFRERGD